MFLDYSVTADPDVPAATHCVSLAEAKAQCRVDGTEENAVLASHVAAAEDYCERATGMTPIVRGFIMTASGFPSGSLTLPRRPVRAVSSVVYIDADGTSTTLAAENYRLFPGNEYVPAKLSHVDAAWPTTLANHGSAVVIKFTAGWDTPAEVPASFRHLVRMTTGYFFDRPETADREPRGYDKASRVLIDMLSVPGVF